MSEPARKLSPALFYSPEMVAELAMGIDRPEEIADRYGVDVCDFQYLMAQDWFGELVARKRQEFQEEGLLFPNKAAMMAEALWVKLFQHGINGTLQQPLMVETAKQLTDIGRLRPKEQAAANGPGFQINIQVNGESVMRGVAATVVEAPVQPTLEVTFETPVPPKPAGLRVPDFDLRPSALVGNPMAQAAANTIVAPLAGSR